MPLKLSVHVPEQPVRMHLLERGGAWTLGRESGCDVMIDHVSVSRRHARLDDEQATPQVRDLGSKNGSRVRGARIESAALELPAWFSVGEVFCRLEALDAPAGAALLRSFDERREQSRAWTRQLQVANGAEDLLSTLLQGIVCLAECQRGFVLLGARRSDLRVRACYALYPEELLQGAFGGSRSAVERALRERRPLYLSLASDAAWMGAQASVVAAGLRALVCLPLIHEGQLLGAVYADTDDSRRSFTELDAELLSAFVEQATTAVVAARLEAELKQMEAWLVRADGAERLPQATLWPGGEALRA